MAYIPKDAKWYLAEIVMAVTVEGDPRKVIHTNFVLVRADSPDEAFERAVALGEDSALIYDNPSKKRVEMTFSGLRELHVIHEPLEHGAELLYEQEIAISDQDINARVRKKEELAVFRARTVDRELPDFTSKDVLEKATRLLDAAKALRSKGR
jgi:hypothetical protein